MKTIFTKTQEQVLQKALKTYEVTRSDKLKYYLREADFLNSGKPCNIKNPSNIISGIQKVFKSEGLTNR